MGSIILKDITKVYPGGIEAVSDFNLEIQDKEFIVLVGPSGCGKSTVLRMIAGLEEITSGELYIEDKIVNDTDPKDRDIAMVFQNYALYPHMTVYKNLAFALSLRKLPKDEVDKKVQETARILEIEELLNRKPKALSGGQRQRVALGRAMVRDPQAFLLDEPLSNLDAKLRASTRTEITKLHNKLSTTFVYVTHDQTEAMTMADRIVVMKDGKIHQVGTPQELYKNPCNIFVAGFIGTPQMNFIDSKLIKIESDYYAIIDDTKICIPSDRFNTNKLEKYIDKNLVLGVRSEDVLLVVDKDLVYDTLDTTIEVCEHMGAEIFVYLDFKGKKIISKVSSETNPSINGNDNVKITFKPEKIHLFDKETEFSLSGTYTLSHLPSY
ncbi:sn-glycerol-3-phosphate ABC transporter ATP-binding protein UgpC [Tissierella sp. Yu-01]|uniref:ABC transporter ATP-binding protein n=1 Tax=Tissierella sp. Yu-01 TaxID=3035694 RepID=UPI00240D6359|nr:sn-glycerol-3-phosphate ABC transporter ATP-binding protein UgpC [Tissierella sp. Yu-01]WFA10030.1 sn-glycerol-3-phosphate ABC transporter ATP-binding protein UgpC [Tissierella sp. Yu-01]